LQAQLAASGLLLFDRPCRSLESRLRGCPDRLNAHGFDVGGPRQKSREDSSKRLFDSILPIFPVLRRTV